MIAYAAYTTNKRSLAAVRAAGWRVLLSPATGLQNYGLPYALDNGAWTAFVSGEAWDGDRFLAAVRRLGPAADFVVLPDIVEGGNESLLRSIEWMPRVRLHCRRVLIPTQDGMDPDAVEELLDHTTGVFVGGSTEHKESTMASWAAMAREFGAWCHVGRANTRRRIALCAAAGADSFDGSSVSRYAKTMPLLDNARRQPDLFVEPLP